MKTFDPDKGYALAEYAALIGSTPKVVREAADRGLIPAAFRPYKGAHWTIGGAALNDVAKKLAEGTSVAAQEYAKRKKRRAKSQAEAEVACRAAK